MPHQSADERWLNVLQLRIVHEILICMGQDRMTVRFAAVEMFNTALNDVPQLVIQAVALGRYPDSASTIVAVISTLITAVKTLYTSYLQRFCGDDEASSPKTMCLIYLFLGIIFRIIVWATLSLLSTAGTGMYIFWVFCSRLQIYGLKLGDSCDRTTLEWTGYDPFIVIMSDVPFITNGESWMFASLLTFTEVVFLVWVCAGVSWNRGPFVTIIVFIGFWWLVVLYVGIKLHGSYLKLPCRSSLIEFLRFWRVARPFWKLMYEGQKKGLIPAWNMFTGPSTAEQKAKQEAKSRRRERIQGTLQHLGYCNYNCDKLRWRECIAAFLMLICFICIFSIIIGAAAGCTKRPCNVGLWVIGFAPAILCIVYIVSIWEAVSSPIGQSLRQLLPEEKCYDKYLQARCYSPQFHWWSESYHYEKRIVTTTDSSGKTVQKEEEIKVVTRTQSMKYEFDDWVDTSDNFPCTDKYSVVLIQFTSSFFDQYTKDDYETEWKDFVRRNNTDTHQSTSEQFLVNGNVPEVTRMFLFSDLVPKFLRFTYFIYSAIFLASFWFRWFVSSFSVERTVKITKCIRKNPPGSIPPVLSKWSS